MASDLYCKICFVTLENSFKVLSQWYFTPAKIAKCLPTILHALGLCSDVGVMKHILVDMPHS